MLLMAAAFTSLRAEYAGLYSGVLNIAGEEIDGNIAIFPGADDSHLNFVLANFGFLGLDLGDIVVPNIPVDNNGKLTIENYPFYLPLLMTRVGISINDGSFEEAYGDQVFTSAFLADDSLSVFLQIEVPDLGVIPVVFSGNKFTDGNYAVRNGDFEDEWEAVSLVSGKTTIEGVEPKHWSSFITGSGELIAAAANNKQLKESNIVRPGSTGSKSAAIMSTLTLNVKANGNMTTGRINGGSMSAIDSTKNYAYTDRENDDFCLPFQGAPDSIVAWVRFVPANKDANDPLNEASFNAVLHKDAYYQDPTYNCAEQAVARADKAIKANEGFNWERLSLPFRYTADAAEGAYMLVTLSTCSTPGGGTTKKESGVTYVDTLLIDDVEAIYCKTLKSLTIDGEAMSFQSYVASTGKTYCDSCYEIVAEADGTSARPFIGYDAVDSTLVIIVMGGDYAGNTTSYRRYVVGMSGKTPDPIEQSLNHLTAFHGEVYSNGSLIFVESQEEIAALPIYGVDGRMVGAQHIVAGTNVISGLPQGMYILAGKKAIIY